MSDDETTQREGTTFNFGDGKGMVPAHRHINPDGSPGGWVADTAQVADTATVGYGATVGPYSKVFGNAIIRDHGKVLNRGFVTGDAIVEGNGCVSRAYVGGYVRIGHFASATGTKCYVREHAVLSGECRVFNSKVFGHAFIAGNAIVRDSMASGHCEIREGATVERDSLVFDHAKVLGTAALTGAVVGDHCIVRDDAHIVHSYLHGNVVAEGSARIRDHSMLHGNAVVRGNAQTSSASVGGNALLMENAELSLPVACREITKGQYTTPITEADIGRAHKADELIPVLVDDLGVAEGVLMFEGVREFGGRPVVRFNGIPIEPDRSREVLDHSDEFEWGHGGSGPAQLALAMLLEVTTEADALAFHQDFKDAVIRHISKSSWKIETARVMDWIEDRRQFRDQGLSR